MNSFTVEIVERVVYQTIIEAATKAEAIAIASDQLLESDGPESAFGSPAYGETEVEAAYQINL